MHLSSFSSSFFLVCLFTLASPLFLTGRGSATNPYEDEAKRAVEAALGAGKEGGEDESSLRYRQAFEKASRERKPLLVWVGGVCPKCIQEMPWAVHVTLESFERDPSQRVVLGITDTSGTMRRVKTWTNHFPSSSEVRAALEPPIIRRTDPSPPYKPRYQEQCPPSG